MQGVNRTSVNISNSIIEMNLSNFHLCQREHIESVCNEVFFCLDLIYVDMMSSGLSLKVIVPQRPTYASHMLQCKPLPFFVK